MPRPPAKEKLKFNQPLTKVPSGELLKRLQTLHKELSSLDQENIETDTLDAVRKELIGAGLLLGKDKGVKAYVACCLADLLRLYAPDAPYTGGELKDIFQFFIRQLKNLTGPACPNYQEYFYLVESLSNVKSAVLMCDVPGAEQLIIETFKQFFDLVKPELPKNVISCFADILSQLLEESQSVHQDVVDMLLAQYLPKSIKSNPTGLALAVEVCNVSSDRLQRHVAHYFTEVILNAQVDQDEDQDSEEEAVPKKGGKKGSSAPSSVADTTDFIVAHDLIKSINRSCPSLLTNVIPQLEEELLAEDVGIRSLATRTLGDMFSDKPLEKAGTLLSFTMPTSRSDLARKYPSTWKAFLGRARDKMPSVRLLVLENFKDILSTHGELAKEIYETLRMKMTDPDEKVRMAACAAFQNTDYEAALHGFDKGMLLSLADRIQDKKHSVQKEALHSLSRLYNHAFGEIANGEEAAIERFAWIPAEIFKSYLVNDRELHTATEKAVHDYILPLPSKVDDESLWVDRLLIVMQHLDPLTSRKGLLRATRLYERRPMIYERYLDACEAFNGGAMDADEEKTTRTLKTVCRIVASQFPDPTKAETDLNKFAKLNENRIYKLLRSMMDPSSDLKTTIKNHAEALKRIEAASSTILKTFSIFIRRSAFLILNQSSIPHLVKAVQKSTETDAEMQEENGNGISEESKEKADNAMVLLETIAKQCPLLYRSFLPQLAKTLLEEKDDRLIQLALYAFSTVALADPEAFQRDTKVLDKAYGFALDGNPAQARFAATFITKVPDNEDQAVELVQELALSLPASSGARLISHLNALKRLARYGAEAFATRENELFSFLLGQLSSRNAMKKGEDDSMDLDIKPDVHGEFADWCSADAFLPEHQACILGLKILTNYMLTQAGNEKFNKSAGFFRLLETILVHGGKSRNFISGPGFAGRLRLQAAISLLKLGQAPEYEKPVMKLFQLLAWTLQDIAFEVRGTLVHKLVAYVHNRRLPSPKFHVLLFIPAHDPDPENLMMAQKYVSEKYKTLPPDLRLQQFDLLLVRLIHLLAHHPDFGRDPEELKVSAKYIEFFLDCVATKENVSVLYYLAMKVKTVRDGDSQGHSENLYILSELAQHVIKARASIHGWNLQSHPAQIKMPSDIFKPLPSKEVAQDIQKTAYLSSETIEQLGVVGKPVKADLKKVRQTKSTAPKKRKSSPKPKKEPGTKAKARKTNGSSSSATKKAASKKKEWNSQSEDDDEEDEEEESDADSLEEVLQAHEYEDTDVKGNGEAANGKGKQKSGLGKKEGASGEDSELTEQEDGEEAEEQEEQEAEEEEERPKPRPANLRQRPKPTASAAKPKAKTKTPKKADEEE